MSTSYQKNQAHELIKHTRPPKVATPSPETLKGGATRPGKLSQRRTSDSLSLGLSSVRGLRPVTTMRSLLLVDISVDALRLASGPWARVLSLTALRPEEGL